MQTQLQAFFLSEVQPAIASLKREHLVAAAPPLTRRRTMRDSIHAAMRQNWAAYGKYLSGSVPVPQEVKDELSIKPFLPTNLWKLWQAYASVEWAVFTDQPPPRTDKEQEDMAARFEEFFALIPFLRMRHCLGPVGPDPPLFD
jgi:hypothetical protein